jgi:hypothetical protein
MMRRGPSFSVTRLDITDEQAASDPSVYTVVDGPVDTGYPVLPPELDDEKMRVDGLMRTDPAAAIPTLIEWVERFPAVPTVKSWLATCYRAVGRLDDADRVAEHLLREHPGYLFGRLYWAERLMDVGSFDKVPSVLAPFDLKGMFPDRTEFHCSEALGLWASLARYRLLTGHPDAAADHLWDMRQWEPNHPLTRGVERMLAAARPPGARHVLASSTGRTPESPRGFRQGSHTPKKDRNRKGRRR